MSRPLRSRVWFWKPELPDFGEDKSMWIPPTLWERVRPCFIGGDEFNWHTVAFGYGWTGRVIIATHPCPMTGKCGDPAEAEFNRPIEWPIDSHGHNHVECHEPGCYCRDDLPA